MENRLVAEKTNVSKANERPAVCFFVNRRRN
jgi:hypothetical protein